MKLYLVRHGETVWNKLKKFQGSSDSPLTDLGVLQSRLLGEKLKNQFFDACYFSPLKRTKDTLSIMNPKTNLIEPMEEFIEISMGILEGVDRFNFPLEYPVPAFNYSNNPEKYDPSEFGGESFFSVKNRVVKGLNKIIETHKDNSEIMVVSHGTTLKVLFNYINGHDISVLSNETSHKNTSLSIVEYNNSKFEILSLADISHLR